MSEKKKWVVKMVILDAKDAKVSDISQIKCMHDDSTKNPARNDAEQPNIVIEGSVTRKEPRAQTARSKPKIVSNQRNLRSSKKNTTAISSSNSDMDKCMSSMQDVCDEDLIEKKNEKMLKKSQKSATINMPSSVRVYSKSGISLKKNQNYSLEKEKILISDPSSSDTGALAERSSKTTQECGPSMPVLFDASGNSPKKSSWEFEIGKIPAKIKKRRFTTGNLISMNSSRLDPSLLQEKKDAPKSKVVRQETTTDGKTNTPSSDQKDPHSELLELLAKGRKYFLENFNYI